MTGVEGESVGRCSSFNEYLHLVSNGGEYIQHSTNICGVDYNCVSKEMYYCDVSSEHPQ